ncbi:MAG: sporulation integral membrane protein YtvI [Erysipelotrichaceae bacterium]|nr:sporulation integral membrane protein YtvI [Erysipelotrichaceae bacterium]
MEKKKEFIINVAYIAVIFAIVYFCVNYLIGLLFPFIMGFIFATASVRINKRFFKDDKKLHRVLTLILIYILIILVISLLVGLGVNKLGDFFSNLPSFYKNTFEPYLENIEQSLYQLNHNLPVDISSYIDSLTDNLFNDLRTILSSFSGVIVNITKSTLTSVPGFLVSVLLTVITSFYIIADYDNLTKWVMDNIPEKAMPIFTEIKDFINNVLLKILSAYSAILGITFVELCIGLTIIGVSNSPMWAFLIAFLDILPVLGVGTVLIPWGITSLITGKVAMGIELLVLYVIITIIRQIIEPHMVGANLGLHPLATLISMIVGLKMFGAIGMFGLPMALAFFYNRSKSAQQ